MRNEVLFITTLIFTFFGTLAMFRYFGRKGIYAWISFASVVINIEVLKCVNMFGLSVTLGNVLYGSTFLCTDILSENYGGKESRKAVRLGLLFQVIFIIMSQLTMAFQPNDQDFVSGAYKTIFNLMPRLCVASITAFFISNTIDTYLYDYIAKKTDHIWLRNNGSTMTSQMIDTAIFTLIAFAGIFNAQTIGELILTTYAIKMLVAVIDTPFAYMGKRIFERYHTRWEE